MKKLLVVLFLIVFIPVSPVWADEPVELPASDPLRPATAVYIPTLGMYWPVRLVYFENGIWPTDHITYQAMHFQGTGSPGEGNMVLGGHRTLSNGKPGPFYHLDLLEVDDNVFVYDGNEWHEYVVTESFVVNVMTTRIVAPTEEPTLTLLTCHNLVNGIYIERLVYFCEKK